MGIHRGAPLVPQGHGEARCLPQCLSKGGGLLGTGTHGAVHVLGIAQHQLRDPVLREQPEDLLYHHLRLAAVDDGGEARQRAGDVGDGDAGVGVAVINGHDLHSHIPRRVNFSLSYTTFPSGATGGREKNGEGGEKRRFHEKSSPFREKTP